MPAPPAQRRERRRPARRGRRGLPRAARHDRGEPRGRRRPHRLRRHVGRRRDLDHHDLRGRRSRRCWRPRGGWPTSSAGARCCSPASAPSRCSRSPCALAPSLERAAGRARAAGRGGRGDDPGLARGRAGRHAAGAARGGDRAWSAAGALAAAAGPAIGGVLVDTVGWRALFLINVPVGAGDRRRHAAGPAGGSPATGALPDVVGTAAARRRDRRARRSASPRARTGAGATARTLGTLIGARARDRRRAAPLGPPPDARARDRPVALAAFADRQPRVAALRRRAVPVDARRRPLPRRRLGLLAARGRAVDDAGRDHRGRRGAARRAGRRAPRPAAVIAVGALVARHRRAPVRVALPEQPSFLDLLAAGRRPDRHRHRRDHHRHLDRRRARRSRPSASRPRSASTRPAVRSAARSASRSSPRCSTTPAPASALTSTSTCSAPSPRSPSPRRRCG